MKKLNEIPQSALAHIQTEHERALAKIVSGDEAVANFPARPVNMRIQRPGREESHIETTIIPPMDAYVSKQDIINGNMIGTSGIRYVIPYTGKSFPYGHIFVPSGYLCLGTIFVPSTISIHNPQQPLETLFLHNDRNTGHGNASIKVSKHIIDDIFNLLAHYDIHINDDIRDTFAPNENLLRNDAPWILTAEIVKQTSDIIHATNIADAALRIMFGDKD